LYKKKQPPLCCSEFFFWKRATSKTPVLMHINAQAPLLSHADCKAEKRRSRTFPAHFPPLINLIIHRVKKNLPRSGRCTPRTMHSVPTKDVCNILCSFRDCSAQDLSPEEATLCPLDDLLVDGLWWVVHDDCASLVIDLCVYTCVADEVDNPLLTLILRETKAGGEIPG